MITYGLVRANYNLPFYFRSHHSHCFVQYQALSISSLYAICIYFVLATFLLPRYTFPDSKVIINLVLLYVGPLIFFLNSNSWTNLLIQTNQSNINKICPEIMFKEMKFDKSYRFKRFVSKFPFLKRSKQIGKTWNIFRSKINKLLSWTKCRECKYRYLLTS